MKKIIVISLFAVLAVSGVAYAQENDLPPAGITPGSPFYFLERAFEGLGTFFTFGNSAKAERFLKLAEERLSEAKVLAERGDDKAQDAIENYEEQFEKAAERAERAGDVDIEALVAESTVKHLSVLDEVIERVPEQAKDAVRAAKERSITGQIEALRGLAQKDPERATDIFAKAAEGRLNAAKARAERGGDDSDEAEDVEEALKEYEKYAEFGKEISSLAEGLQAGDTTVEDLVKEASQKQLDILEDVSQRVPEEAQQGIQKATESARKVQELRPTIPTPTPAPIPSRSQPEAVQPDIPEQEKSIIKEPPEPPRSAPVPIPPTPSGRP